MTTLIHKGLRRELRKRVPLKGGDAGFTTIPDGYELSDVEVTADLERIARQLGIRAAKNKSGRSSYLSGAVVVKVVKRERVKA